MNEYDSELEQEEMYPEDDAIKEPVADDDDIVVEYDDAEDEEVEGNREFPHHHKSAVNEDDEDGDGPEDDADEADEDEDEEDDEVEEGNRAEAHYSGTPDVTDEELDKIADTAIAALDDILKYFDLGEVTIDEYEGDEGELILDITGDDLAVLIGRHGKTLEALQFVISSITTRTMGFRYPVVIDVEGYKGRQRQKLENLAFSSAKRALSQNKSVKMRPMTPYERRIIHVALRQFDGVSTASEGEGSSRHVVVIPD